MSTYQEDIKALEGVIGGNEFWGAISPESAARMRAQNKFKTGLDIARYTAKIMREDMAEFDKDKTKYTQSLGCWHGFVGQQKLISITKHFGTTKRRYLY
ncbi:MAG: isocitrate lyase, partial [Thalassolituus sp.]